MAWTPTKKSLAARAIPATLLAYFAEHQEEALAWAGGSGLKKFKSFAQSVVEARRAAKPIYPSISFVSDDDRQTLNDDQIDGGYTCTFEVHITGRDPDAVTEEARIYAKAIGSMIVNCPLAEGTGALKVEPVILDFSFDEIRANEKQNEFLQMFEFRLTAQVTGSRYE